jgi:hypothetical protein
MEMAHRLQVKPDTSKSNFIKPQWLNLFNATVSNYAYLDVFSYAGSTNKTHFT